MAHEQSDTNSILYLNGLQQQIFANTPDTSTTLNEVRIGDFDTQVLKLKFNEVIHIAREITLSDRQKLEGYLAYKWNLQGDLPVGHPYKSIVPFI